MRIKGPNWTGWILRQTFSSPYPKGQDTRGCEIYSSDYRCVWMAIGNESMSAVMPFQCFIKGSVYNLEDGLSFDVFMDMVKTVRFGAARP